MTSAKKVAANRANGRKSRGPHTSAGKARASRNARRHGLAAFSVSQDPAMAEEVKPMVDALCDGENDPLLRQQAAMIAENQLWLAYVRAEKVALVERLRDPTAYSLANDTCLARGKARARLFDIAAPQLDRILELIEKTEAAGGDPERDSIPPELEAAWPPPWLKMIPEGTERDEHEALCEGLCDLERLLRYERRAWSQRKKAVRGFIAIKQSDHDRAEPT
jgi:hypothetical protein